MQEKPTVVTPEQIKSTTLDINSLSAIKQAYVYGYIQGVLSVKEPITTTALLQALTTLLREPAAKAPAPTTPAKRYRRPRTST